MIVFSQTTNSLNGLKLSTRNPPKCSLVLSRNYGLMLWGVKTAPATMVCVKYVNIINCLYHRKAIPGCADAYLESLQLLVCTLQRHACILFQYRQSPSMDATNCLTLDNSGDIKWFRGECWLISKCFQKLRKSFQRSLLKDIKASILKNECDTYTSVQNTIAEALVELLKHIWFSFSHFPKIECQSSCYCIHNSSDIDGTVLVESTL